MGIMDASSLLSRLVRPLNSAPPPTTNRLQHSSLRISGSHSFRLSWTMADSGGKVPSCGEQTRAGVCPSRSTQQVFSTWVETSAPRQAGIVPKWVLGRRGALLTCTATAGGRQLGEGMNKGGREKTGGGRGRMRDYEQRRSGGGVVGRGGGVRCRQGTRTPTPRPAPHPAHLHLSDAQVCPVRQLVLTGGWGHVHQDTPT